MQLDFHYYATYCAAYLAGYNHQECLDIAYSAQFVDCLSKTFLKRIKATPLAATTQLQLEMMDLKKDAFGVQEITRIWSSFHFLPYDLYSQSRGGKLYKAKYRLICNTNGDLLVKTVDLAKNNTLQTVGIAMHVLADTWAHRYFAGTPSFVINNTTSHFYEIIKDENGEFKRRLINFRNSATKPDDIENGIYTCSLYQSDEYATMNLGHGRAGHLPDYSFMRYAYLPAWGNYEEIIKDNPSDYLHAFTQMIYAMKYLRGLNGENFEKEHYDFEAIEPYKERIINILEKRQLDASEDWKAFGEELSKKEIPPFSVETYVNAYLDANEENKKDTFLGKFITGAINHKQMVVSNIIESKNPFVGLSIRRKKRRDK